MALCLLFWKPSVAFFKSQEDLLDFKVGDRRLLALEEFETNVSNHLKPPGIPFEIDKGP